MRSQAYGQAVDYADARNSLLGLTIGLWALNIAESWALSEGPLVAGGEEHSRSACPAERTESDGWPRARGRLRPRCSAACSSRRWRARGARSRSLRTPSGSRSTSAAAAIESFNDGALRGLEGMAAGLRSTPHGYETLTDAEYAALVPSDLTAVSHLPIPAPLVLSGKAQEDYEPNLQLLVDQGVELTIAVGFVMEPAVRAVSARNPNAKFLLVDSPVLDDAGKKPMARSNVRAVVFREQEGSFLAGVLAGELTRSGKIGFVGGMQLPLILKFEAGFRAGVRAVNPEVEKNLLVAYTGTFDDEKKRSRGRLQSLRARLRHRLPRRRARRAGRDQVGGARAQVGDRGRQRPGARGAAQPARRHGQARRRRGLSSGGRRAGGPLHRRRRDAGAQGGRRRSRAARRRRNPGIGNEQKAAAIADVEKLRAAIIQGRIAVPGTIAQLGTFTPLKPEQFGLVNVPGAPPPNPAALPAGATTPHQEAVRSALASGRVGMLVTPGAPAAGAAGTDAGAPATKK